MEGGGKQSGREPEKPAEVAERVQSIIDAAQSAAAGILKDAEVQARRRIETSKTKAQEVAAERAEDVYAVTDALMEQARKVRERSGELVEALDEAIRYVDDAKTGDDGSPASAGEEPADIRPEESRESPGLRERVSSGLRAERERLDEMMNRVSETTERIARRAPGEPVAAEEDAAPAAGPPAGKPPAKPRGVSRPARLLATRMAVAGSSRAQISDKLRSEHGVEDAGPLLDEILGPE